jgi:uncharacterized protein YxjI
MEIKIQCDCGTKFKFDVEPVHGRMPMAVACPECARDRTSDANQFIAQNPAEITASVTHAVPVARITGRPVMVVGPAAPPVAAALAPVAVAAGGGLRISRAEPVTDMAPPAADETAMQAPGSYSRGHACAPRTLLERTTFFIKERVAVLKLTDTYDILDPANGQTIGIAKEEPPSWAKFLRLVVNKHKLPTAINIYEAEGAPPVVSVRRGFTLLRSKLQVIAGPKNLGYFKSKLISIGGGFLVFDAKNQQVAEVKGDWKGWNFRFLNKGGREIGTVTKKWAGLGKELFTSADNYIISLNDPGATNPDTTALLLAAGLSIDVVYKEND